MKIERNALILLGVGLIVIFGVWYFMLLRPTDSKISQLDATQQSLVSVQRDLKIQQNSIESGTGSFSKSISQSGVLSAAIPDQPDLAGIINDIDASMETSGIGLISITPTVSASSSPVPSTTATTTAPSSSSGSSTSTTVAPSTSSGGSSSGKTVSIDLTATGRYFQIVDFIDQMQQLPRIYTISRITITGGRDNQTESPATLFSPLLSVNISMATYFSGNSTVIIANQQSESGIANNLIPGGSSTTTLVQPGTANGSSNTVTPSSVPTGAAGSGTAPGTVGSG